MGSSGGQRFAQLLNSGVKSASLARVILVPSRQSGHLSLESLQPGDGFDDNADACGWTNAGHNCATFREIAVQLKGSERHCQVPSCGLSRLFRNVPFGLTLVVVVIFVFVGMRTAAKPGSLGRSQRAKVRISTSGPAGLFCHVDTLTTAPAGTRINGGMFTIPDALGSAPFQPYGDFSMHDVGTGDGILQATRDYGNRVFQTMSGYLSKQDFESSRKSNPHRPSTGSTLASAINARWCVRDIPGCDSAASRRSKPCN
jgi:hypothetical protein